VENFLINGNTRSPDLSAGQEAILRIGHGTTHCFKICPLEKTRDLLFEEVQPVGL